MVQALEVLVFGIDERNVNVKGHAKVIQIA